VVDALPFGLSFQGWAVIVAVVGAQLVVLTSAADAVNIPKLALVLLASIAVLAVTVARVLSERRSVVAVGLPAYAALAFGIAAVIATAVAPATGIALWGGYLRNAGLFLYLAALVLFATVVRIADEAFIRRLVFAVVGVGALLSFYSVLQEVGIDPMPWQKDYPNPVSTFGNPDFAGAFFGIALPLAIWVAVWSGLGLRARAAAGLAVGLLAAGDIVSGAAQGVIGALVGLFVLLLGWVVTLPAPVRKRALSGWIAAAVVGLGLLSSGLASVGPFTRLGGSGAVDIRRQFWHVAWSMFTHHPLVGVGMNMYGDYFRAYRSPGIVSALGYADAPDAPHSVPIAMFANGGLLLGVSYIAFVVAVGIAFVRALRRADAGTVMLVAAVGAAWAAFQVESVVSIDVVPLVVLHFVLAGAIVAMSNPATRTLGRGLDHRRRNATSTAVSPPAVAVAGVAAIVLAWFAIQPLRADVHSRSAANATASGDSQAALADLHKATSEASWQGVYWLQRSTADGAVGNIEQGLADLRHAIDNDPRDVNAVSSLARVEAAIKDYTAAAKYFRLALHLDPLNPDYQAGLKDAEAKLHIAGTP
jgi:putative inorganic carbon (hco3(-)) transporter